MPVFSPENTIGELLAVKQSRDILNRYMPELMNSPWLSQVMGFTPGQAMYTLPAKYKVSDEVLTRIYQELNQLSGL